MPVIPSLRKCISQLAGRSPKNLVPDATEFDVQYYLRRHPDLIDLDETQAIEHWVKFGKAEGRRGLPLIADIIEGKPVSSAEAAINASNAKPETVFLVLHEASRSGAPILGWNIARKLRETKNVVIILPRGGELIEPLSAVSNQVIQLGDGTSWWDTLELEYAAAALHDKYQPSYAIVNSANGFPMAIALENADVPVVGLVHEFAGNLRGPDGPLLGEFFDTISEVVFPAEVVAEAAWEHHYSDTNKPKPKYSIIPQGPTVRPPKVETPAIIESNLESPKFSLPEADMNVFLKELDPNAILVLGTGQVIARKGVDLFIQIADYLARNSPKLNVKFAWIGEQTDYFYSDQLLEQIRRSSDVENLTFLAPEAEINWLNERANIFVLTSRLDPLPNAAMEAAFNGIPIISFDRAGGISEWLQADDRHAELVVPYADSVAVATLIARLATNEAFRQNIGAELKDRALRTFDLDSYVQKLDELGHRASLGVRYG